MQNREEMQSGWGVMEEAWDTSNLMPELDRHHTLGLTLDPFVGEKKKPKALESFFINHLILL